MNRERRKTTLKIINSGFSASNIYFQLSRIFDTTENEIERIITNAGWNRKRIINVLDNFIIAKYPLRGN